MVRCSAQLLSVVGKRSDAELVRVDRVDVGGDLVRVSARDTLGLSQKEYSKLLIFFLFALVNPFLHSLTNISSSQQEA